MRRIRFVAAAAATIMITQPCVAADNFREFGADYRRGAFAGATLKIPMGGSAQTAPRAHFGLSINQIYQSTGAAGAAHRVQVPGMEVGLTGNGKPLFMIAGQDTAAMKRRLGLTSSTGTILLVVGGLAAAALAVTLLSKDDNDEDSRDGPCPIRPPC